MTTDVATTRIDPAVVAAVLLSGDLRQLTAAQKVSYYNRVCESLGLNPLTQPFAYIVLNNKEQLYARKECTDQLRWLHGVSVQIVSREVTEGCYVVTARALLAVGDRSDDSIGAVAIERLLGQARADAMMKAETKAKRRVTLSICGLGMLDESEVLDLPAVDSQPDPAPASPVAETLRQALRAAPKPAAPAAVQSIDEVLGPRQRTGLDDGPPLPAGDPVKILELLPPPSRSDARGHLRIAGANESIPFYAAKVEQQLRDALAAGLLVRLDIQTAKHTGQPYVKGVREADPEDPF